MRSFVAMFEEYNAAHGENGSPDCLLIVDVQKEFEKWMRDGFISELREFASSVPHVYQIWDANRTDGPSDAFPNQRGEHPKRYGYNLKREEIRQHFDQPVQNELYSDFENDNFKASNSARKTYVARSGDILFFVGSGHKFFMAEPGLCDFVKKIGKEHKKIMLCGGANSECLADVEAMLDAFGIPYERVERFIYGS